MKLRIIGGTLKGRNLRIAGSADDFRPTLGRVRRSIADVLQPRIRDAKAVDICAGSGALGFEVLSRGARSIDFVESDRRRAGALSENIRQFRVETRAKVFQSDVMAFLRREEMRLHYDIVLYDPPYDSPALTTLTRSMTDLVAESGIFVFQHATGVSVEFDPWHEAGYSVRTRRYGRTTVDFFVRDAMNTHKGG